MTYIAKKDWKPDTPVTEDELNRIETGIEEAHEKAAAVADEVVAHSADYEYQTPTVVGTQIRLLRQSNTNRLFFKLQDNINGAISISLDNGVTSKPLVDSDGNAVTSIEKGFSEVIADASFFTLRTKGLSGANRQSFSESVNGILNS